MKTIAKHVCNYAVLRFLPYPETGEFVNLGVAVHCADNGFLGVELERRKLSRVTRFFPELEKDAFKTAQDVIWTELERVRDQMGHLGQNDLKRRVFRELVRPRESIFRFSDTKTVLTDDPKALVETLFGQYVRRHFARTKEYREGLMARRYYQALRQFCPQKVFHQNRLVGNEKYHVRLPLCSDQMDPSKVPVTVIKPLDLDRDDPAMILDHGDAWIGKVRRLREAQCAPERIIFAVDAPEKGDATYDAATKIIQELETERTLVVMAGETEKFLALAAE
jgi:hypothetical protein